ncbi:AAA family ATPase [Xanthomonas campestris pv. phormiicola]|nr:AAA family ATPase [Xanthomonas campestris pv. phormiicola]UYC15957.1 AAA family ATPase [Xanthomonas campestris pv. phormiicola]
MRAIDAEHYLMDVTLKQDRVASMQAWPYSLPAVRNLGLLRFHPKVTFIVGENGSGKSTLLEAIAVVWGFNAEGGTRNFNFSTLASSSLASASSCSPRSPPIHGSVTEVMPFRAETL